jgi:nucleoside-diphosphate-sugar epimerase
MSVFGPGQNLTEEQCDPGSHRAEVGADADYAEAKRQAESVFAQCEGLNTSLVRIPIVIGPDDFTGRFRFHVERIARGEEIYFPDINADLAFFHSDAAAQALKGLAERGQPVGALNACFVQPLVLSEFVECVESVANKMMVRAERANDDNHSPYGVKGQWTMSTKNCRH